MASVKADSARGDAEGGVKGGGAEGTAERPDVEDGGGDPYACFFESAAGYGPDMPSEGATVEEDPRACQARCARVGGCAHFTLSGDGQCRLHAADARKGSRPLDSVAGPASFPSRCAQAARLVDELVTFGAPAVSSPALSNPGAQCIPGLRIYAENAALPGGGFGKQTDAAAMLGVGYMHPETPVLVLHEHGGAPSIYVPCPGEPRWPLFGAAVYHDWQVHFDYWMRLWLPVKVLNHTEEELQIPFVRQLIHLAGYAYRTTIEDTRREVQSIEGWRVVGYAAVNGRGDDVDRVFVAQHRDSRRCVLAFEGSQGVEDVDSFFKFWATGFCGFRNTRAGVRDKLRRTVAHESFQQHIKPPLEHCTKVTCTGHSLGGSLCELLTACANSGRTSDPDYKLIAWHRAASPDLVDEA